MPQTAAGNLGTQLGELLFGRGRAADDRAYVQGQAQGALVGDRMASARRSRAAAMIDEDRLGARQGITPESIATAGYAPNQAALLGDILRSNTNIDLRDLGTLQSPGAGQALTDAGTAIRGGDKGLGNALLALAQGEPLETTRITQGQAYNPHGDADQQVNLTAIGDALVREKGASAAYKHAQTGNADAMADVHRKNAKDEVSPEINLAPLTDMLTNIFGGGADQPAPGVPAPVQPTVTAEPRRAPDGNLYVPDPNRPGKWLRVDG
jgi:hypothetical protein